MRVCLVTGEGMSGEGMTGVVTEGVRVRRSVLRSTAFLAGRNM